MYVLLVIIALGLFVGGLIYNSLTAHQWHRRRTDDPFMEKEFYRFGLFYYNPDDPRIILPKRLGGGFTLNFGKPIVVLLTILFAGLILSLVV